MLNLLSISFGPTPDFISILGLPKPPEDTIISPPFLVYNV